jgi:hypothetical protein
MEWGGNATPCRRNYADIFFVKRVRVGFFLEPAREERDESDVRESHIKWVHLDEKES